MNRFENGLLSLSLVSILILSSLTIVLLNERTITDKIVYVYIDDDIDSDFGTMYFSRFGYNLKSISDFAKIPTKDNYIVKFFDIIKLSNGKTVTVNYKQINNQGDGTLEVRNIDLFDNFGNMIVHEESINHGNDRFGFARIFEFEDGYFVIWRSDGKLMIIKFNFDGLMIGEKEEIYDISYNNNFGFSIN